MAAKSKSKSKTKSKTKADPKTKGMTDVSEKLASYPAPGEPGFSQRELRQLQWQDQPPSWGEVKRRLMEHELRRQAYDFGAQTLPTCIVCGDHAPREAFCDRGPRGTCRLLVLAAGNKQAEADIANPRTKPIPDREKAQANLDALVQEKKKKARTRPQHEYEVVLYGGEWHGKVWPGALTPDDPFDPGERTEIEGIRDRIRIHGAKTLQEAYLYGGTWEGKTFPGFLKN